MSQSSLITYLNDHLAGSVVALELLDHLMKLQAGTAGERQLQEIREEVAEDRQRLQNILRQVGGKESRARKAAAWLTEKLGRAKLHLEDGGSRRLEILEALETLALGILGKAALWRALAAVAGELRQVGAVDFSALEQRAHRQFQRVDGLRLQAAAVALSLGDDS